MEKSKNPAILCVIHHRQNHLESTSISVVCDVTPYSLIEIYKRFDGTYWLILQGRCVLLYRLLGYDAV
jgi:hypothetical protein